MGYGNIRYRPDLSPLFGQMSSEDHDRIRDLLLQLDDRLVALARDATEWVGRIYEHTGLGLYVRDRDAEIAGGPFGVAGDIWFEISYGYDVNTGKQCIPPWIVDSRISIYCSDEDLRDPHYHCIHELISLEEETYTPVSTVETLARHIDVVGLEIRKWKPAVYINSLHTDLIKESDDNNKS